MNKNKHKIRAGELYEVEILQYNRGKNHGASVFLSRRIGTTGMIKSATWFPEARINLLIKRLHELGYTCEPDFFNGRVCLTYTQGKL